MSSDIYFNVPSWFPVNVRIKPHFNTQVPLPTPRKRSYLQKALYVLLLAPEFPDLPTDTKVASMPTYVVVSCYSYFSLGIDHLQLCAMWLFLLRGHPYNTSAYFWSFWTPPTQLISINTVLYVSENGHFLDPPTRSFCWRNIGMASYLACSDFV